MLTQCRLLLAALSAVGVLASAYSARATSVELFATPFTGNDTSVRIVLDDAGGDITVTLTVDHGPADLRGFFISIKDFSLLDGLDVTGDDVTDWKKDGDGVINLGQGNNLNGGGTPCPCDLGVTIGTPGKGKDDISATTFVIDADANLTLDDFAGKEIGVRVTSEGAKLLVKVPEQLPIPEPSTALLLALGAAGLGYAGRARR